MSLILIDCPIDSSSFWIWFVRLFASFLLLMVWRVDSRASLKLVRSIRVDDGQTIVSNGDCQFCWHHTPRYNNFLLVSRFIRRTNYVICLYALFFVPTFRKSIRKFLASVFSHSIPYLPLISFHSFEMLRISVLFTSNVNMLFDNCHTHTHRVCVCMHHSFLITQTQTITHKLLHLIHTQFWLCLAAYNREEKKKKYKREMWNKTWGRRTKTLSFSRALSLSKTALGTHKHTHLVLVL